MFWDVAPGNLAKIDQRFRGTYYLHYDGDSPLKRRSIYTSQPGATPPKAVIFILVAMRT
jgi:hypothetical protein